MPSQSVIKRIHISIRGAVQGVGFRPFIFRLATEMGLPGWVCNANQGVFIEVEGNKNALDRFLLRLQEEKPSSAFIQSLEYSFLDPVFFSGFEIRYSDATGLRSTVMLPDIATCPDCLREVFDPENRRYRYPFTNCTLCGPRFSIIESLPYDRMRTSMKIFAMCPDCRSEYENPEDRRFHAQPNACPTCGPHLEFWDTSGGVLAGNDQALKQAAEQIRAGRIVAVKGIGGFHLMADARNSIAVELLRTRKHREEKPLALMFPSLEAVEAICRISALERRLLQSPESPIVLVRIRNLSIAEAIAPNNPYLGVMLPYSPLHHLLMRELGFPVVATSGNLSDEPICTDEHEALERLGTIADSLLVHNRPIVRHVDDSILCVTLDRELMLRRARGYAPLPVALNQPAPNLLAVGGHLKNTIALTIEENVFISQHIGDLETTQALEAFEKVIGSLRSAYPQELHCVVADAHPDYASTRFARNYGPKVIEVQHHFAHVASCLAENQLEGQVLGVSWDGTGYGGDGTIWGGEFLLADATRFRRVGHFRTFRLPGGTQAIKEPRRSALGLLYEIFGNDCSRSENFKPIQAFTKSEMQALLVMLRNQLNAPVTSSVGRLFDAVASLLGLRQCVSFEGQAAMELEFAASRACTRESYPFGISEAKQKSVFVQQAANPGVDRHNASTPQQAESKMLIVDWEATILAILDNINSGVSDALIAATFHNTLASAIVEIAKRVGQERIVLTGGCFQNRYLTEQAVLRLESVGFKPYWHQRVPPNDGGISLGQAFAVAKMGMGEG